ncbi:DUF1294 domain-containing protein [uncultured Paraglaciecola sp.]|uniref:DUF1294 domain-containing protein n=1 Tax=uncultured Paraglaciecola sp. TaxID=1765024 RepID=UPI0026163C7F|nr:DUF1294 domain-containing protein [uncultured Paraglaciecola sp.]
MRGKGKLISWNAEKAFGFIAPLDKGSHIFIHKSGFNNKARVPAINDIITYTLSADKKGRTNAIEATFSGEKLTRKPTKKVNKFSMYLAVFFLATIVITWLLGKIPHLIPVTYCLLSLFTYIVYAFDKSNAKNGDWRTSEATLHGLALAGGWPGAAFAQQLLRHKSQKKEFRIAFWMTVLVNCR